LKAGLALDRRLRKKRLLLKAEDVIKIDPEIITEIEKIIGPLPFKKKLDDIVVYQDTCHLRNVQKV
jgi:Fe-S oxidoreductase